MSAGEFLTIKVNPGYILAFVIIYAIAGAVTMYGEFQSVKQDLKDLKEQVHDMKAKFT